MFTNITENQGDNTPLLVLSTASLNIDSNTGQLTLFYDDSLEPPDPDDYQSLDEYEEAWEIWCKKYPDILAQTSLKLPLDEECRDLLDSSESILLRSRNLVTSNSAPEQIGNSSGGDDELTPNSQNCSWANPINPAPEQKISHWVEMYWVVRSGEKHYYYRYCYRDTDGKKLRRHLSGGNTKSPAVLKLKEKIQQLITSGAKPPEILEIIQGYCK